MCPCVQYVPSVMTQIRVGLAPIEFLFYLRGVNGCYIASLLQN